MTGGRAAAPSEEEVAYAGVHGQAALLRDGRLRVADLLDLLINRIRRLDPAVNAFRVLRPADDLAADAAEAQRALDGGDSRPLLGVPFAVKDNLDLVGETTEHGTIHIGERAEKDAEQVRRMRAAGMIPIGKTTMPELALWPFGENRSTGITRNPYGLQRTPGGSSSGSGAAVAAGFVPVATATDGGGSIRIPAACCGLVGLKPSHDVVPLEPADHWEGLSAAGVLTRTVADTAAVLDVITEATPTFASAMDEPIGSLRVAHTLRAPSPAPSSEAVQHGIERMLDRLRELGASVTEKRPPYGPVTLGFLPRYAAGAAQDAAEIVPSTALLEPRTQRLARLGRRVPRSAVTTGHRISARVRRQMESFFEEFDLLVLPTISRPAQRVGRATNRGLVATMLGSSTWVPFCVPWNVTGLPALSLPTGLSDDGLPLAVQLVAGPGGERRLLQVAAALEAARGPLPAPRL